MKKFLDQRTNKNEWIIRTVNKLQDLYKQIFDICQDMLVKICSKVNDDKMVNHFLRMSV